MRSVDVRIGEHLVEDDFDVIAPGGLGAKENPYLIAPFTMETDGLPYGAWCICSTCGFLGRSTFGFDFFGESGNGLDCESCVRSR